MIFKSNGILVTPEEYNTSQNVTYTYYATDISTFHKVTGNIHATPEYAGIFAEIKGKQVYAFDPYAKEQKTAIEIKTEMENFIAKMTSFEEKKSLYKNVNYFSIGDIIIRPNHNYLPGSTNVTPVGSGWGHAACVTRATMSSNDIDYLLQNTWNMEAYGSDVPLADQIREANCYNYWSIYAVNDRIKLTRSLTTTQRNKIKTFVKAQDPDKYNIWDSYKLKSRDFNSCNALNLWYCSLLVWQAYYYATGLDIDKNGGVIVYPNDIINSSYLNGERF